MSGDAVALMDYTFDQDIKLAGIQLHLMHLHSACSPPAQRNTLVFCHNQVFLSNLMWLLHFKELDYFSSNHKGTQKHVYTHFSFGDRGTFNAFYEAAHLEFSRERKECIKPKIICAGW